MNIYQLKNIKKNLNNFSLTVKNCSLKRGTIYSVVGPNGSGKSTFLNILSLYQAPCEGQLFFEEQAVDHTNQSLKLNLKRKIAHLMQNPYLFNMSVRENISYGLRVRRVPKKVILKKVEEILKLFSLSRIAEKNAHYISGGEAQRTALARTFVLDAQVYLLDEPAASVDKNSIHRLEELILSFNQEKKAAIILTTHSQEQAYRMSKDIISIIDGQIKDIAYENVFSGVLREEKDGIKSLNLAREITLKLSSVRTGPAAVAIDPQDIILSKNELTSSALNRFYGKINKLEEANGSLRVFIDTPVTFCALITQKSFYDMELNIGRKVWATFKANSIKLI